MRELLQDEVDGLLSEESSRALAAHVASCASCRRELEILQAIDRALAERPLVAAPRWLPSAVLAESQRRAARRTAIERAGVAVGVPLGSFSLFLGVRAILRSSAAGEAASDAVSRLAGAAGEIVAPLGDASQLSTSWMSTPGAQGVVLGLAACALSLIAVTALRLTKERSLGWN